MKPRRKAQRPLALICYICGRQYGKNSLEIHIKQCRKLWIKRESLKPAHERKPIPQAPQQYQRALDNGNIASMGAEEMLAQNQAAADKYNKDVLEACPNCGRSFLPRPLKIHLKSCRPGRLIGERLKAHSGKAGGNLGLEKNPHRSPKIRPGSARSAPRRKLGEKPKDLSFPKSDAQPTNSRSIGKRQKRSSVLQSAGAGSVQKTSDAGYSGGHSGTLSYNGRAKSGRATTAPSMSSTGADRASALKEGVHQEWQEAYDPDSGRNFYYNAQGETRWTLPTFHPRDDAEDDFADSHRCDVRRAFNSADAHGDTESTTIRRGRGIVENESNHSVESGDVEDSRVVMLEKKVSKLSEQLAWAVDEIHKLRDVMEGFKNVFRG